MNRKVIFTLIGLIFLFSCKEQVKETTTNSTPNLNSSCNIARWPNDKLPINLKMAPSFQPDFGASTLVDSLNPIEQMAKKWNDSVTALSFFNLPMPLTSNEGYDNLNSFYDGEMGVYKSSTWFNDVRSSVLAITLFYGRLRSHATLGNYIELSEADIIVNDKNYNGDFEVEPINFLIDGESKWNLHTIILHEMGHFLGLCHDNLNSSIMRPYYSKTRKELFTFDQTKIRDLYINNVNTLGNSVNTNAISMPDGTFVKGVIELDRTGKCKHYINNKLVYEH